MGRTQSVVGQEGKSIELTAPISMASDIWKGKRCFRRDRIQNLHLEISQERVEKGRV